MRYYINIEKQIQLLKTRGMTIQNEVKAAEILGDIGFYHLGFYMFPFEKSFPRLQGRNHEFVPSTTFADVVELYYFDFDLRQILMRALNRIEVNIKNHIINHVSLLHVNSPTWFVDTNVVDAAFVTSFKKVYDTIRENPAIQRHHRKYINDKYAPAWKTMEFMTLGNLCKLYDSIKSDQTKTEIANHYGCTINTFNNYLETIRIIRNKCAHGACLYNLTLVYGVKLNPAGIPSQSRQFISGATAVIAYMLNGVSCNRADEFKQQIKNLLKEERSKSTQDVIEKCAKFSLLNFVGKE